MTIATPGAAPSASPARAAPGGPAQVARPWRPIRPHAAAVALIIAAGAALRLAAYAAGRPLWLDEALIAINLLDPPPDGLLGPLSFAQGAPPGFLWAQSVLIDGLGPDEHALRLLPLISGLGALALFWPVARRVARPRAALPALALFATLAPLVHYSSEAKQYSGDVLAALAVTWAALLVAERPRDGRRALAAGLVGAGALWLSHAALLVLAGVAPVLAIAAVRRRDGAALRLLAGAGALWVASATAAYAISLRHLDGLQEHVVGRDSPFSPPLPPRTLADLAWPADTSAATLRDLAGWPAPLALAAALLVAAGAYAMLRRDATRAGLILAPAAVALVASALERYPFGGRFVLFLMPALVILLAEGGLCLRDRAAGHRALGPLSLAPLAALIGWQLWLAGAEVASPRLREDIRPALLELAHAWRPSDRLYVSEGAQYAFRYYADAGWIARASGRPLPWPVVDAPPDPRPAAPAVLGRPPHIVIGRSVRGREPTGIAADLAVLAGGARTWVLVSHAIHGDGEFLRERFDAAGRRLRSERWEGAELHLYDLRRRAR